MYIIFVVLVQYKHLPQCEGVGRKKRRKREGGREGRKEGREGGKKEGRKVGYH